MSARVASMGYLVVHRSGSAATGRGPGSLPRGKVQPTEEKEKEQMDGNRDSDTEIYRTHTNMNIYI